MAMATMAMARAMAAAVRKMTEIAGEEVTPAMEEMIRRLEAGEDPEKVEEELGDAIQAVGIHE